MKINILFGVRKLQIEINKYKIVREIRGLIPDLWKANIGNDFQFIYKNIILNDEKMITFYNLKENDEIKIGKLEQFLNNDDVIVELFISGWNATFIYFIVKRNDRISTIRSMISTIIPEVVNIWNMDGNKLRNNQFVKEIDLIGGYYKLIISDKAMDNDLIGKYSLNISDKSTDNKNDFIGKYGLIYSDQLEYYPNQLFVFLIDLIERFDLNNNDQFNSDGDSDIFGNENDLIERYGLIINDQQNTNNLFEEYLKMKGMYLMSSFIDISIICEISMSVFLVDQNLLISRMNKLKEILSMNEIIAPNLNENLANIPSSFLNSQLLFCTIMSNRIWKICENYFNTMIYQFTNGLHSGITHLFMTSLKIALIQYIKNTQSNSNCNQSLRNTVIKACDNFLKILEYPFEYFGVVLLIVHYLMKSDPVGYTDKEQFYIIFGFLIIKINDNRVQLFIPSSVETILQLKKTISMQTNIPMQHLQLIKDWEGRHVNDGDNFYRKYYYSVEVDDNS